jgi:hypothetical protein
MTPTRTELEKSCEPRKNAAGPHPQRWHHGRMPEVEIANAETIAESILVLRGTRILLDRDPAALYGVETRTLNQAAKRNAARFPEDFRFRLTPDEVILLRSQIVILDRGRGQHVKFPPYAFTEHGAIMAATLLDSPNAIEMSLYVVRAFVQLRKTLASNKELARQLNQLQARIETKFAAHDDAITRMLAAIRRLMTPPESKRRRIGFTTDGAK